MLMVLKHVKNHLMRARKSTRRFFFHFLKFSCFHHQFLLTLRFCSILRVMEYAATVWSHPFCHWDKWIGSDQLWIKLEWEGDQPAEEQNIPVLRTRNASIRRPTCKPNFLHTALCQTNKQTKALSASSWRDASAWAESVAFSTLTCRNRARRHSRRTLRHTAQSRTPTPATQRWQETGAVRRSKMLI